MVTEVERLVVSLEARTKAYENALARAHNTTVSRMKAIEGTINASAGRTESRFAAMGRTITRSLGALGVGLSFAAISRGLGAAIGGLASLEDAAVEAGTSVARLQELISAGVEFGIGQDDLVKSIAKFNDLLGEAVTGGNELGDILAANKIRIQESNGQFRDTVDVLLDIAGLVQSAGSVQERQVILTAALGREGRKYAAVLSVGREQLEASLRAANELGNVIGDDVVKAADDAADAWDRFVLRSGNFIKEELGKFILDIQALAGFLDKKGVFGESDASQQEKLVQLEERRALILGQVAQLVATIRDIKVPEIRALEEEKLIAAQEALREIANEIGRITGAIDKVNQKKIAPVIGPATVLPGAAPKLFGGVGTHAVPGSGGGVATVRVTGPVALDGGVLAASVSIGVRDGTVDLRTGLVQAIDGGHAGVRDLRTGLVSAIGDVSGHVDSSGENITGAIGRQTSTLNRTFGDVARHLTEAISSSISGPGSGQSFTSTAASPNFVAGLFEDSLIAQLEKQIEARQAEINVLQTGLQFKQLTTEQTKEAQLAIAKLTLEIEQFGQGITTASQGVAQSTGLFADVTTLYGDQISAAIARAKQAGATLGSSLTAAEAARLSKINTFGMFASGGMPAGRLGGVGTGRSDSNVARFSRGEFLMDAKHTEEFYSLLEAIRTGRLRKLADGGLVDSVNAAAQRFANGGLVRAAPTPSSIREVRAPVTIVVNTPDAESFRGSEREIARRMAAEIQYAMQGG